MPQKRKASTSPNADTPDEFADMLADIDPDGELEHMLTDGLLQLQMAGAEYYTKLSHTASQLTDQAREVYDVGQHYVRTSPWRTLTGAFAVGAIIGVLWGRE